MERRMPVPARLLGSRAPMSKFTASLAEGKRTYWLLIQTTLLTQSLSFDLLKRLRQRTRSRHPQVRAVRLGPLVIAHQREVGMPPTIYPETRMPRIQHLLTYRMGIRSSTVAQSHPRRYVKQLRSPRNQTGDQTWSNSAPWKTARAFSTRSAARSRQRTRSNTGGPRL